MKRRMLLIAACALAAAAAQAQTYPDRPIKIIAGTAAGGSVDKMARALAQHMQARLGQPVVVDNRPGGGGTLADELLIAAPPDGYTLILTMTPTIAITPVLEKLRYDPIKDTTAVGFLGAQSYVLLVPYESRARTAADVAAQAKAQGSAFSYSSGGRGTGGHLGGELFSQITGLPMTHVPYRGVVPAMTDVIGGMVSVTFATTASSQGVVAGKKLRAVASTGNTRTAVYPDLPTMQEAGFAGYELSTWYGISAPARTPAPIVALLNKEINAFLADKKVRADFESDGIDLRPGTPDDFRKFEIAEQARWRRILEKAGLAYKP